MFHVKNRLIIAFIAACLAATTLTACSGGDNREPQREGVAPSVIETQPESQHYMISDKPASKPARITKSADGETVYTSLEIEDLSIVQMAQADKNAAKNMRKIMDQSHNRHISAYESALEALNAELTAENVDLSVFPHETKIDYTCTRNDGKAISITEKISSYSAGNLTREISFAYNFDPATGEQIKQVFYQRDDKQGYNDADSLLYSKLLNEYGSEAINYSNIPSSFVDEAEDCWYFTADGIKISFNPGEIAPESFGIIETEYAKEELPEFAQKYFN